MYSSLIDFCWFAIDYQLLVLLLLAIVLVVVVAVVIIAIYRYATRNHDYWQRLGLTGPRPLPFVGTIAYMTRTPLQELVVKWQQKYGKLYGCFYGNEPVLVVADPELIKDILVKDFDVFVDRDIVGDHPILSRHLFHAVGNDWRRIRSIVTPGFSSAKLKALIYPRVRQCLADLCSALDVYTVPDSSNGHQRPSVDMKTVFCNYTLDSIVRTAFSLKIIRRYDQWSDNQILVMAKKFFRTDLWAIIGLKIMPNWLRQVLNLKYLTDDQTNQFFFDLIGRIIDDHRQRSANNTNDMKKSYDDFMDLLLISTRQESSSSSSTATATQQPQQQQRPKYLTENELIGQSWVFFNIAHEVPAAVLTMATYQLAKNPAIQQKLYDEVMAATASANNNKNTDGSDGNNNDDIDYDILAKLPYLDAIVAETLRLYSPVHQLYRIAGRDYPLGDTGIIIKKGQKLEIPVYAVHVNPEYYDRPMEFIPDRFLPETGYQPIQPYTYLPFSAGSRQCFGQRFALMEIKLCLAQLVKRYRFQCCQQTDPTIHFQHTYVITVPLRVVLDVQLRDSINQSNKKTKQN
ncbi:cytochrome P450 3A21-like [Oppia nitens]|uniref:cytochrome P450 3A21-like n=1 Tax=Oppia nitens TaxID=1686743 RepID=UPI0023DB4725|nr:cytochrome P450 3A21-like [Oppia nitens]